MSGQRKIRAPAKILVGLRFKQKKIQLIKAKKIKLLELKMKKGLLWFLNPYCLEPHLEQYSAFFFINFPHLEHDLVNAWITQ